MKELECLEYSKSFPSPPKGCDPGFRGRERVHENMGQLGLWQGISQKCRSPISPPAAERARPCPVPQLSCLSPALQEP